MKAQTYAEHLLQQALDNKGENIKEIFKHDPDNEGLGENLYYGDGQKGELVDFCGEADKLW